jgi:hypothetical protein
MAVAMKNVVFWDLSPCSSCKKRRLGRKYRNLLEGENNEIRTR